MENGSHNSPAAIKLQNVTRRFGTTLAVNDVSFEVRRGEVFGFIGPNGAGKTTSMRILSTLDVPDGGEAWIDGFSVVDDPEFVRQRLGFMPDGFGTYPNMNCEEYLDFFARAYGMKGINRRTAIRNVMQFTQLDSISSKPVDGLSKGMKQRLCLGRTLIHNPSVLILDEPAAGLDPRARIELRDMIKELASQGKTLLVSSHILTELAEMCDRVGIIEQGALLAVGTVDEILSGAVTASAGSSAPVLTAGRMRFEIQLVSDPSDAVSWLSAYDGVESVQDTGEGITFEYFSENDRKADLLEQMIAAKIRVSSFAGKQVSLEEAFLHVTQGRVQ